MLTKWLIKALERHGKMTAEERSAVRKLGEEPIDEIKQKSNKKSKRRIKTMQDETKVTENEEVKQEEIKKVDEEQKQPEKVEEPVKEEPKTENPEVQEVEPVGNGVRVEDLVTKDELMERLSAFEAKFDALVKENTDLKDQLSKSQEETNDLKDKYENKDFGNVSRQGVIEKDKSANETFDSYAKQFLQKNSFIRR